MNCHCIRISINHNSRSVLYEHTWKDLIKELWPSSAAAVKEGRIVWFFVSSNSYLFKDFLSLMRSISARPWCFWVSQGHFCHKRKIFLSHQFSLKTTAEEPKWKWNIIQSFEKVSIELSQDPSSSTFLRIASAFEVVGFIRRKGEKSESRMCAFIVVAFMFKVRSQQKSV